MKGKVVSVLLTAVLIISVLPLSALAASPVLALDTPLTLIPGAGTAEATFTPTETGVYQFSSESVDALNPADPDLTVSDTDREIDRLAGDGSLNGNEFLLAYFLEGGKTYTLSVTDSLASSVGTKVAATKPEVKKLAMNTPLSVVPGCGLAYVTFTPDKDGEYTFSSAAEGDVDPYLCGMDFNGDEEAIHFSGETDDHIGYQFRANYRLRVGYTYTLVLRDYRAWVEGFTVTVNDYHDILEQPSAGEPTVTVTTPEKATFQWHQVDMVKKPLVQGDDALDGWHDYDDTTSQWIGEDRDGIYWLLNIRLKSGEALTVKSADKILVDDCTGYGNGVGNKCAIEAVDANTVRFSSSADMLYEIMVATDGTNGRFDLSYSSLNMGAKMDGQTTATLTKFEKNKHYGCVVTYPDGVSFTTEFVKMEQVVAKQPTAADPSVKVTFPEEVKGYQWYQMNINKTTPLPTDKVTDYYGEYDTQTGEWTGSALLYQDDKYGYDLFEVSLSAGQALIIEGSDTIFAENGYMDGQNGSCGTIIQLKDNMVALTIIESDIYGVGLVSNGDSTTFKVWIGSVKPGDAVSGQTTATLTDYDKDAAYMVKVTYGDGVELASDVLIMSAVIVKQPTAAAPSVTLNNEDEVKSYQWYAYEKTPITNQNAKAYEYGGQKATFDSATGTWTGIETHWEFGHHGYFVIDLKAGDRILLDAGVELENPAILEDMDDPNHWILVDQVEGEAPLYVIEADQDGSYYLCVLDNDVERATVKAWLLKAVPVAGEMKAALGKTETGKTYFCEITYKDGEKLTSEFFEATKTTGLVIEAAAADPKDKAAQQALLDKVNEQLKDKELTENEKKVLTALKAEIEKNIAEIENGGAVIENSGADQRPSGGSPATGVADNVWLWLVVMLTAFGGIVTTILLGRKKQTA